MTLTTIKRLACLAVASFALGMAGCASGPKIHSVYEQGVNFNNYQTFSFLEALEPQGAQQYRSLSSKYLTEAIRRELTARGLKEVADGQLLVGFNVSTKEKIKSTSSPSMSAGYYGYRGRYGYSYGMGYGTETRISQYTEGTLNIDVVDASRKQLIWEGVAVGKLKEPKENELQAGIDKVVAEIFTEYPVASVNALELP